MFNVAGIEQLLDVQELPMILHGFPWRDTGAISGSTPMGVVTSRGSVEKHSIADVRVVTADNLVMAPTTQLPREIGSHVDRIQAQGGNEAHSKVRAGRTMAEEMPSMVTGGGSKNSQGSS